MSIEQFKKSAYFIAKNYGYASYSKSVTHILLYGFWLNCINDNNTLFINNLANVSSFGRGYTW